MAKSIVTPPAAWGITFLFLVLVMIGQSIFITTLPTFEQQGDLLSLGITLDLAVGIPLFYYLVISRKLKAPAITTLVVFILCVGVASLILPAENQFYLDNVKRLLILTELFLLSYLLLRARAIIVAYTKLERTSSDFTLNLRSAMARVMGENIATTILASEISMLRYGLLWWKLRKEVSAGERAFSVHIRSGYFTLWLVFVFVILIETSLVHVVLWRWNTVVAILATVLSLYGLIFFIADLAALIKRPVTVTSDKFFLRTGLRWSSIITRTSIKSIETIRGFDRETEPETLDCSILRDPNIRITLHESAVVHGLYGIRKTASCIVFNVDDEGDFLSALGTISSLELP